MKINKETFEVFEPVDKFDTLLDYQTGSTVFGELFDSSKIIIGDDKDPNRKFVSNYDHLQNKPKSYKSFFPGLSVFQKFNSLPDNFNYPINKQTNEPNILVAKEAQEFLKLFNKKSYTTNPDNIFDYDLESSQIEFISFQISNQEADVSDSESVSYPVLQKSTNVINNEIQNVVKESKVLKENHTVEKLEKIWEKIVETKKDELKQEQINNIENKFNKIENSIQNDYKQNNIVNTQTLNTNNTFLDNTILNQNNKTEFNQYFENITEVINKNLDQKITNVVNEINNTINISQTDLLLQVKKIVQSSKEESEANKKEISQNTTKILKDFMRS